MIAAAVRTPFLRRWMFCLAAMAVAMPRLASATVNPSEPVRVEGAAAVAFAGSPAASTAETWAESGRLNAFLRLHETAEESLVIRIPFGRYPHAGHATSPTGALAWPPVRAKSRPRRAAEWSSPHSSYPR